MKMKAFKHKKKVRLKIENDEKEEK